MTRILALACLGLLIVLPLRGQQSSEKSDKDKLQGNWKVVVLEDDGKNSLKVEVTVIFKGDKAIYQEPNYKVEATFQVDAKKTPKHLDLTLPPDPQDKNDKGLKIQGIYQLEGDTLKICYRLPPAGDKKMVTERPTAFDSKKGGTLIELKRAAK